MKLSILYTHLLIILFENFVNKSSFCTTFAIILGTVYVTCVRELMCFVGMTESFPIERSKEMKTWFYFNWENNMWNASPFPQDMAAESWKNYTKKVKKEGGWEIRRRFNHLPLPTRVFQLLTKRTEVQVLFWPICICLLHGPNDMKKVVKLMYFVWTLSTNHLIVIGTKFPIRYAKLQTQDWKLLS